MDHNDTLEIKRRLSFLIGRTLTATYNDDDGNPYKCVYEITSIDKRVIKVNFKQFAYTTSWGEWRTDDSPGLSMLYKSAIKRDIVWVAERYLRVIISFVNIVITFPAFQESL